ncbi:MAG: RNA 2',3'-cyclic phosphodiesterase, partial [Candidatus Omnitrophica bacterium]|nr:RNA 2',3'-cyclic phosphodiesterase [Candidatus Omnitrophota bacterium]
MLRTFIAIPLSSDIHALIERLQKNLKELNLDVKWVKPTNAHLTLKFLGDTPAAKIPTIHNVMKNIFAGLGELSLTTTVLGTFPELRR